MKFENKTFSLISGLLFLSVFFLSPLQVYAEGENICDGKIPEIGKKFIKVLVSDNSASAVGGQPACISIPEGQYTIGFNELSQNIDIGGGRVIQIIPRNWSGYTAVKEGIYCDPADSHMDAPYRVGNWYPKDQGQFTVAQMQLGFDKVCLKNTCGGGAGCNRPANFQPYEDAKYNNRQPLRYQIHMSNENSNKFVYILGVQQANESEKAAKEACLINFKREMSKCIPESYNPSADTPASLLEKMKANPSLPARCIDALNVCILNSTVTASSTPRAPTLAELHANDPHYQKPKGYNGPLPDCAFSFEGCRNINDLLILFINLGKSMFAIIGTFAFVMFVYGGFTMVLSMGSAEKVKKGRDVLVAAIVGIIIAFGAYLIIDFILDALQVSDLYRAVGNLDTDLTNQKQ